MQNTWPIIGTRAAPVLFLKGTLTMIDLSTLRRRLLRKLTLQERHHNHRAARRTLYWLNRVNARLGITAELS